LGTPRVQQSHELVGVAQLPEKVNANDDEYAGIELTYSGEWYRQRLSDNQNAEGETA